MNDKPLAYFITWTVYGTFLQRDKRWWRSKSAGESPPQPRLEQWHRERLNHEVLLLDTTQRAMVESEIERLSMFRNWHLWVATARTNHVHVVVTATSRSGKVVRDQMKANCTRVLRENYPVFVDRSVWTVGGDWKCVNTEDDLERAVMYVGMAQDRMDRNK